MRTLCGIILAAAIAAGPVPRVKRVEYVKACHEYIDVATANIHTRGERMMEIVSRTMPSDKTDSL